MARVAADGEEDGGAPPEASSGLVLPSENPISVPCALLSPLITREGGRGAGRGSSFGFGFLADAPVYPSGRSPFPFPATARQLPCRVFLPLERFPAVAANPSPFREESAADAAGEIRPRRFTKEVTESSSVPERRDLRSP